MKRNIITLSLMLAILAFGQTNLKKGDAVRLSPRLLNYQGYLTDTLGNPVTNPSVSVTFGIWSLSSGGSQIWYETQSVSVSKGVFSVMLGNVTPLPDSVFTKSADRWLELTYAGITLSPRTRIVAAGYAVSATYSDTAYSVVNNAITTPKILDTAVTMAKIARTGATANQVIKWNGSAWAPSTDVASSDTDWIFSGNNIYSGVSGNVGIGTSAPGAIFTVNGSGQNYGSGIRVTNGANWWEAVHDGAQGLTFGYNGSDKFVLNRSGKSYFATGNVGIGTTTPNAMLSFGSNAVDNKIYLYDGAGDKYGLGIRTTELMVYCGPSAHTAFGHYDGTTFTELMRLDYLGNMGLGTASPIAKLDINGGAVFRRGDGDTIGRWSIVNNSVSTVGDFGLYFSKSGIGSYLVLGNSSNNSYFPNGNIGVGTATPAVKFDVAGYVRSTGSDDVGGGLSIFNSSKIGATVNNWMIYNMTGVYGNALKFWRYNQDGSNPGPAFTVYDNGNAEVVGVTLTNGLVTTGITMANGAASGYVLTSNASGVASWQAPSLIAHDHLGETWSGYYNCGLRINMNVSYSANDVFGFRDSIVNGGTANAYGGRFSAYGSGNGSKFGIYGSAVHDDATGSGNAFGGRFYAGGSSLRTKYAIYGSLGGSGTGWAGYFWGKVYVNDTLFAATKVGDILETPKGIYATVPAEAIYKEVMITGTVKLQNGEAKVILDEDFTAVLEPTIRPRVFLTAVNAFGLLSAFDITKNGFTIKSQNLSDPNCEVDYQVVGRLYGRLKKLNQASIREMVLKNREQDKKIEEENNKFQMRENN